MSRHQVVLVGAGHAHLEVIRHAEWLRQNGLELVVVAPGNFWYSGLATRVLSGVAAREDDRIVLADLCTRYGVTHVRERVLGAAPHERLVWLGSGRTLEYYTLSFNVGSGPNMNAFDTIGSSAQIWPTWPVRELIDLHKALRDDLVRGKDGVIAVVGGGASGCEVAANLATAVAGSRMRVRLVTRSRRLWPQAPPGASRRLARELSGRGVDIVLNSTVTGSTERIIHTSDGRRFPADHIVLATGPSAPGLMQATGLPATEHGLMVRADLSSPGDPHVFAAGDCAVFMPRKLPCHGMHSSRQAPVLINNLAASLRKRTYRKYNPRRQTLTILDLGHGTAIARRGRLWWHGRKALDLKRRLDGHFMARFRRADK